jgi:hypothetical protein
MRLLDTSEGRTDTGRDPKREAEERAARVEIYAKNWAALGRIVYIGSDKLLASEPVAPAST